NQYQDGCSERGIRALQDTARSMAVQQHIPAVFWPYLLQAAADMHNCTWKSTMEGKTSYQAWWDDLRPHTDNKPDVGHFRIIGSKCFVHLSEKVRHQADKLDIRALRGTLLGFRGFHNYQVWVHEAKRVMETPHVVFHEDLNDDDPDGHDASRILR